MKNDIVSYYKKVGSLKGVSKKFHFGIQKVRKILISANAFTSPRTTAIADALKQGMTIQQIADSLHINPSTVNSYLPYSRSPLISWEIQAPRSPNAVKIHACRKRKKAIDKSNY